MFTLQRKLVIYLLMIWAAPLYFMVRYFYGKAFYRAVVFALIINIIVLPLTLDTIAQESGIDLSGILYQSAFIISMAQLTVYALPLHLYWIIFTWLSSDTRYDLDNPGRPPLPLHPWLIDIPAACAVPLLMLSLRDLSWPVVTYTLWYPTFLRAYIPDWLTTVRFTYWQLIPAISMSAAYLAVCFLTTPAPKFQRRRKLKLTPTQPQFDVVRLGTAPKLKRDTISSIVASRSPDLQALMRE